MSRLLEKSLPEGRDNLYICRMATTEDGGGAAWAERFFRDLARPDALFDLFDSLPGIYLYVKDRESRFVRGNRVICEVVGVAEPRQLVGKTDFDYFPPAIAAKYRAEDRRVLADGRTLANQVWVVPGKNGVPHLYLCNKIPLYDRRSRIVGIAGIKRPYEHVAGGAEGYGRLARALSFVADHYAEPIDVGDVADHLSLSVSQLQREFARCFQITPKAYIREVRIGVARRRLETGDRAVSEIALECGFYDQSHFTHHFKRVTGMTPLEYRRRFRVSMPPLS